jgi:hypothetical protein
VLNPFRPGAGRRPPVLAGREPLLDAFEVVRRRAEELGEGDRSWVLNGLRGVGKTVLLNEMLSVVNKKHWIAAKIEIGARVALGPGLGQALYKSLRTATGIHPESRLRRLLGVFQAFTVTVDPHGSFGFGVNVGDAKGVAASGRFGDDLADLFETMGETARDLGIGVLLLVDEMQEGTTEDLDALNTAIHYLGQAETPLPVVLVGAGLPSLPAQLADATSYAERLYEYRPIGPLADSAARDALTLPTRERGVEWDGAALLAATTKARGYPYFLQAIGKHVWDNTRRSPIDTDDVEIGLREAQSEVDEGLYKSRWERATPAQRDLLRSLAEVGGESMASIKEIAEQLGKRRTNDISVARKELINKGIVFAPERGFLAFTVPGMDEYIGRQP